MPPKFLEHNGQCIAYKHHQGAHACIVFLPGFRSDMNGAKASAMEQWCAQTGLGFAALDYRAHGESLGDFREFTIGGALQDALAVIDTLGDMPMILVGSSMGGWIALLAAMERKERICGVVGIAAAPDFTERLIWNALGDDKRRRMEEEGELSAPSEYGLGDVVYTHALITEGRAHLLLEDIIPLSMPIRLLQGMQDEDVPWMTAMDIQRNIASDDVQVTLIKDGDHRLSRVCDLALLCSTVAGLITTLSEEGRIAA